MPGAVGALGGRGPVRGSYGLLAGIFVSAYIHGMVTGPMLSGKAPCRLSQR